VKPSDADSGGQGTPDSGIPGYRGPRACAWPPRPQRTDLRLIAEEELRTWIVFEDEDLLVIDKPGDIPCHPSKAGPASSLVGAARLHTGLETVHPIFRLDRETSGLVLIAKNQALARRLQKATERRAIPKSYLAILTGELGGDMTVDQPLGDDLHSPVFTKAAVVPGGRASITHFRPIARAGGYTLARVVTETGRKHQIRVHAAWLGHALVGDKIYGPDARLYLEFIATGWTPALESQLLLRRQALHCETIDLRPAGIDQLFKTPLPPDMAGFCRKNGLE
jgi:23S rRNA pseudouridine1911/1915/1917 synthase